MKWVFWIAAATIVYSYVGYAVWLWLRCRWSPRPVRRGPVEPAVSAVMVVRNEEAVLARKLENLLTLDYPAAKLDVVVVSDGSTDRTTAILKEFDENLRVRTLLKPESQGKALGLNDAIKLASGEILLFTDARQAIEPAALRLLVENFADPAVGCVSGELMLGDPSSGETEKGMGLYWRIEKKIREMESASGSVAGATGALYCARRDLLEPLPAGTILDDVLLPMQVLRKGARVVFDSRARAWTRPTWERAANFPGKFVPQRELSAFATRTLAAELPESDPIRVRQPQAFPLDRTFRIGGAAGSVALFAATVVSHSTRRTACILWTELASNGRRQDRAFVAGGGSGAHNCRVEFGRVPRFCQLCDRQKGGLGPLSRHANSLGQSR
jgi:hypothetical protein